jgi:phosphatidylserine/phosphatidylglycerophosphate/cardiolipin synthase-like enzyme
MSDTQVSDIQAHFSGIRDLIVQEILTAKYTIIAAVAWLTDPEIIGALLAAARKHVVVQIAILKDDNNSRVAASLEQLSVLGGSVFWIPVAERSIGSLHHKFCVLDSEVVITGSFNWTRTASKADENIIVIRGHESIVIDFEAAFRVLLGKYGHHRSTDSLDIETVSVTSDISALVKTELQLIAQLRFALLSVIKDRQLVAVPIQIQRFQDALYDVLINNLTAHQITELMTEFNVLVRVESRRINAHIPADWMNYALRLQRRFPFSGNGRTLEIMFLKVWDSDDGNGGLEVDTC